MQQQQSQGQMSNAFNTLLVCSENIDNNWLINNTVTIMHHAICHMSYVICHTVTINIIRCIMQFKWCLRFGSFNLTESLCVLSPGVQLYLPDFPPPGYHFEERNWKKTRRHSTLPRQVHMSLSLCVSDCCKRHVIILLQNKEKQKSSGQT